MSYTVGNPPISKDDLEAFVLRELRKVSDGIVNIGDLINLNPTHSAPDKPRSGNIRFADGTNWDPGSGEGVYIYRSGAWHFLG